MMEERKLNGEIFCGGLSGARTSPIRNIGEGTLDLLYILFWYLASWSIVKIISSRSVSLDFQCSLGSNLLWGAYPDDGWR
jgi:hypothetical protein